MEHCMEIYYDPLDAACKTITGAVPRGEELQLNLFSVPAQAGKRNADFR